MPTRVRLAATLGFLCGCGIADAHHSFGTFDLNRNVEIVGTIDGIDFVNPHSWLRIDSRRDLLPLFYATPPAHTEDQLRLEFSYRWAAPRR